MATRSTFRRARGVTLIELVAVMTVLAIIVVAAAVALRDPVNSYVASERRAELTDAADTALRRMGRDVRLALPNSVRVKANGSAQLLEFLLTKTGGRYRARVQSATGTGDFLDFTTADTAFDTLGLVNPPTGQAPANNDILVVHNLFSSGAITTSNAYTFNEVGANSCGTSTSTSNCNTARISGTAAGALAGETRINFDARRFPLASPGNRFYVIERNPVTYVCTPGAVDAAGNGTGSLTRVSGYNIALAQPTPTGPVNSVLARFVTRCTITYDPFVLTQSLGLVSIELELTRANEKVTLYHEVHVSNVP